MRRARRWWDVSKRAIDSIAHSSWCTLFRTRFTRALPQKTKTASETCLISVRISLFIGNLSTVKSIRTRRATFIVHLLSLELKPTPNCSYCQNSIRKITLFVPTINIHIHTRTSSYLIHGSLKRALHTRNSITSLINH